MLYLGCLALAVGLGLPIAAFGVGLGQGKAVASAMEAMARQPEAAGQIRTAMIIGLALLEALVIYALLMFFMLFGRLPSITADQAIDMAKGATPATTTTPR